jgi:glycine cleavage system H protein
MNFPDDLRYTKDHEWARKEDNAVTIGVTAFAVEQLGDITLVDLPEVGDAVKAGESFGTIESVKSVSDLYAPVAGKVVKINEDLEDKPELVNEAPYGDGWMVTLELEGDEYDSMLDQATYADLVAKES